MRLYEYRVPGFGRSVYSGVLILEIWIALAKAVDISGLALHHALNA